MLTECDTSVKHCQTPHTTQFQNRGT